jgi:hypothetical protein
MITASDEKIRLQFERKFNGDEVRFQSTKVVPILNKPSDYRVCVENFTHYRESEPNILKYNFYTDLIPVSSTLVNGQQNQTKQLLFEYMLNNYSDNLSSNYVSYMSTHYYYYGLYSNEPLYQTNLYVTKTDLNGNETPLSSGYFCCTLLFEKK